MIILRHISERKVLKSRGKFCPSLGGNFMKNGQTGSCHHPMTKSRVDRNYSAFEIYFSVELQYAYAGNNFGANQPLAPI